jgi:hypothetical protein
VRKRTGRNGLSGATRKPEETVEGTAQPARSRPNETLFVTLIYMSPTISDISIAIAGCGVTIEPGQTERDAANR